MAAVSVSGSLQYAGSRDDLVSGRRPDGDLVACLLHKGINAPANATAPAVELTHPWLNDSVSESPDDQALCDEEFYNGLARARWLSQSLPSFLLIALLPPSLIAACLLAVFWIVSGYVLRRPW